MSKLRAAVEKAKGQFLFYAKQHRDKYAPGQPPMPPGMEAATREKAIVNEELAAEMQAALDAEPFAVLELEKVADYRFASMVKPGVRNWRPSSPSSGTRPFTCGTATASSTGTAAVRPGCTKAVPIWRPSSVPSRRAA